MNPIRRAQPWVCKRTLLSLRDSPKQSPTRPDPGGGERDLASGRSRRREPLDSVVAPWGGYGPWSQEEERTGSKLGQATTAVGFLPAGDPADTRAPANPPPGSLFTIASQLLSVAPQCPFRMTSTTGGSGFRTPP